MIRFAQIEWLFALGFVPIAFLLFFMFRIWRKKALSRLGETTVINRLFPYVSRTKPFWKLIFFVLAYISAVIGLAGPQIGTKLEESKRKGVDIIIAIDVSNSMNAEDLKPNRLERTKQLISRLLDKLKNDRVGLIVFAGKSYIQLPITTDYAAAKLVLSAISTDIIPIQGTAIGSAIELAQQSFTEKDKTHRALIIITDGENHEDDPVASVKKAAQEGIIIHTIGMGSKDGVPIPIYQHGIRIGFFKDRDKQNVVTKLDETILKEIAVAGNGIYIHATNSDDGLNEISKNIDRMEKKEFESRQYAEYEDRFQFFFAAALLFLLIEFLISEKRSKLVEKINLFGENK